MTILLDHTIVPARDKEEAARFFADIFGLRVERSFGHFAPVRVNDTLTLDFDTQPHIDEQHYAFKVGESEFDQIFGRIRAACVAYGSGPMSSTNGEINHRGGGRGCYFRDPSGHLLEILTA